MSEKQERIAIYPGSFDPITNGHIDIISRASKIFDKIIVLIAINPTKEYVFTSDEKKEMAAKALKNLENVSVDTYDGLTVKYAKEHNSNFLIRGIRAVTDFEYEFELAAGNEYIDPSIDCVFFMAHKETSFISSSMINLLKKNKIDVSNLVPNSVIEMYKNKFNL